MRLVSSWCSVCCTEHSSETRCPGELIATSEETEGWRVSVDTLKGVEGYGVLLARSGRAWRARIVTFPRMLWTVPGGGGAIKFIGPTREAAQAKAIGFIRGHCTTRRYIMYDQLEPVPESQDSGRQVLPVGSSIHRPAAPRALRDPRIPRILPVRFGENLPTLFGRTGNLSASGLFLRTESPMDVEKLVGLILELEHIKVNLRGSVVWACAVPGQARPSGMGLRLLKPPGDYVSYVRAIE